MTTSSPLEVKVSLTVCIVSWQYTVWLLQTRHRPKVLTSMARLAHPVLPLVVLCVALLYRAMLCCIATCCIVYAVTLTCLLLLLDVTSSFSPPHHHHQITYICDLEDYKFR